MGWGRFCRVGFSLAVALTEVGFGGWSAGEQQSHHANPAFMLLSLLFASHAMRAAGGGMFDKDRSS